jgi:hypothetical protein
MEPRKHPWKKYLLLFFSNSSSTHPRYGRCTDGRPPLRRPIRMKIGIRGAQGVHYMSQKLVTDLRSAGTLFDFLMRAKV